MSRRVSAETVAAGILAAVIAALPTVALCADSPFVGSWRVTIDAPGVVPYEGRLDIEKVDDPADDDGPDDGDIAAWLENGPAPVTIDGDRITIRADARDRQGFRFERVLSGELEGDRISGSVGIEGLADTAAEFGEDGAPFSAIRIPKNAEPGPPPSAADVDAKLRDFDGTWVGVRGRDLRKYSMDLTEAGRAWTESYDARMDEPQKRCVSPGLVAAATWIFPFELLVTDDGRRVVMLYEAFGLTRRVHMDRDELPEFYPESSMGYSRGRFEDGQLIIETELLAASTRDFNGEPVSEDTRILERYYLSDEGRQLNLIMTMHDPTNYRRPPLRRRAWERNDDADVLPFECDPDSFFRQLHDEGRMQEYIDRAHMRP